tara:strand:- start:283 stop:726 length:444 start_codon:yes stop_codon:yes gene_type:complete
MPVNETEKYGWMKPEARNVFKRGDPDEITNFQTKERARQQAEQAKAAGDEGLQLRRFAMVHGPAKHALNAAVKKAEERKIPNAYGGYGKKRRKSIKRKSIKRKSIKRKSLKRKTKRRNTKRIKSLKRKTKRRKSIERNTKRRKSKRR